MRIIAVLVNIEDIDILKDKYLIFKFEGINIQIGMCWRIYTQFYLIIIRSYYFKKCISYKLVQLVF
jgi:hypothetical protein